LARREEGDEAVEDEGAQLCEKVASALLLVEHLALEQEQRDAP